MSEFLSQRLSLEVTEVALWPHEVFAQNKPQSNYKLHCHITGSDCATFSDDCDSEQVTDALCIYV